MLCFPSFAMQESIASMWRFGGTKHGESQICEPHFHFLQAVLLLNFIEKQTQSFGWHLFLVTTYRIEPADVVAQTPQ